MAGGEFTRAGDGPAPGLSRWDGVSWEPIGTGVDNMVTALAEHEGSIVAGGLFDRSGKDAVEHVARWDEVQQAVATPARLPGGRVEPRRVDLCVLRGKPRGRGKLHPGGKHARPVRRPVGRHAMASAGRRVQRTRARAQGIPGRAGGGGGLHPGRRGTRGLHRAVGRFSLAPPGRGVGRARPGPGGLGRGPGGGRTVCPRGRTFRRARGELERPGRGARWAAASTARSAIWRCITERCLRAASSPVFRRPGDGLPGPRYVGRWSGTTWEPLPGGPTGAVLTLTVFEDRLAAGGVSSSNGVLDAAPLVTWDGSQWHQVQLPVSGTIRVLTSHDGCALRRRPLRLPRGDRRHRPAQVGRSRLDRSGGRTGRRNPGSPRPGLHRQQPLRGRRFRSRGTRLFPSTLPGGRIPWSPCA